MATVCYLLCRGVAGPGKDEVCGQHSVEVPPPLRLANNVIPITSLIRSNLPQLSVRACRNSLLHDRQGFDILTVLCCKLFTDSGACMPLRQLGRIAFTRGERVFRVSSGPRSMHAMFHVPMFPGWNNGRGWRGFPLMYA
jgi:hypothetical protein